MMTGQFMAFRSDGTPTPLGKVTEINMITESPTPEPPLVHLADDTGFTVTVALTKKDKKAWAKILNMPKYVLTEWIFSEFSKTWYIGDMCGVSNRVPTAWMPLPEPYKGE